MAEKKIGDFTAASTVAITDEAEIKQGSSPRRATMAQIAGALANDCAFLAHNSATDTNQTGNGATATVDFDTEIYDVGNDFAADTFTAPATGKYLLIANVVVTSVTTAMTTHQINIVTSNRTYSQSHNATPPAGANISMHIAAIVDMDSGDTATVTVRLVGGAGDTAGVLGDGSQLYTYFSGMRVA